MPDVTQYSMGRVGSATDFSVRFSGQVLADYSQTYTFYTRSDDGVRLWVNNQLLIDNWNGHAVTENQASIYLTAGQWYDIKMEYMQMGFGATIQLNWSSPSIPRAVIPAYKLRPYAMNGLSGQWYADTNLGALRGTFVDPTVDFADTTGLGAARAGSTTNFTVRWTGQVLADTNDTYTFTTRSDDGARLWVNGTLLVDNWTGHTATDNSGAIHLSAGQWYDIKFEYGQLGGGGTAQLSWASSTMAKAIISTSHLRPYAVQGGILRQNAYSGAAGQKFVISDAGDGFFKLCVKASGKCLEIESARKDDAAQVRLSDYRGAPQQMWAITSVGGSSVSVVNRNSAKSIKSTWDSKLGSAIVQQWPYIGYDAEIFTISAAP